MKINSRVVTLAVLIVCFISLFSPFLVLAVAQANPEPRPVPSPRPIPDPIPIPDSRPIPDNIFIPGNRTIPDNIPVPDTKLTPEQNQPDAKPNNHSKSWDDNFEWKFFKFVTKDLMLNHATFSESLWRNGFSGSNFYLRQSKLTRGFLGFFDNQAVTFISDTWDVGDTAYEAYSFYQQFNKVREIAGAGKGIRSLSQQSLHAEVARNNGFSLSKLGRGLAWADIGISGYETIRHVIDAYNSDGQKQMDSIFKAVGSAGSVLRSAGALAGPTPLGIGLMAVGTVAGIVSWGYKNRGTIKKGVKWLSNKLKRWFL